MQAFMKVFSMIVFIIAALLTALGVIGLFVDGFAPAGSIGFLIGGGTSTLLLSGAVWLLADISEMLRSPAGRID